VTGWKTSHEFMAKHAMIPVEEFKMKELVGNAVSFFGAKSMTSGGKSPKKPRKVEEAPSDGDK
jgi:hypothetical protein